MIRLAALFVSFLVLTGCAGLKDCGPDGLSVKCYFGKSEPQPYWVPVIMPDAVYEAQILPTDFDGRVIFCTPAEEYLLMNCLAKGKDGYIYVQISLAGT
jgi:hypothetical protein